jgi:hypothetical protein
MILGIVASLPLMAMLAKQTLYQDRLLNETLIDLYSTTK